MNPEHHGYIAVLVLLAISALALTVPEDSRHISAAMTLLVVAAFLLVVWTLLYDR